MLAGGQARRFGSDKAYARYKGERLLDIAGRALVAQCNGLVICGREESGFDCIADRPEPGIGPLGGINAALHHARAHGYDAVLSVACDIPELPDDLLAALAGEGAAIVQNQPVVGFWPVAIADRLDEFLEGGGRKMFDFALLAGARLVELDRPLMNVNRPEDLPGG